MHGLILSALTALLMLGACTAPLPVLAPPPASFAQATTLDERGLLTIEVAYRAAGLLLEAAVDAGRLRGADALRAERLDAQAAQAVALARAAYDAGNAADYAAAVRAADPIVTALRALLERAS